MELSKIKNLVKQNGDKFIVVENGEPELVVMSFDEYRRLAQSDTNATRIHANNADSPLESFASPLESLDSPHQNYSPDYIAPFDEPQEESAFGGESVEETEFDADSEYVGPARGYSRSEPAGLPVRLEDIRLEDLPI